MTSTAVLIDYKCICINIMQMLISPQIDNNPPSFLDEVLKRPIIKQLIKVSTIVICHLYIATQHHKTKTSQRARIQVHNILIGTHIHRLLLAIPYKYCSQLELKFSKYWSDKTSNWNKCKITECGVNLTFSFSSGLLQLDLTGDVR
jgi:hypothetical protein